jgi:hypothetical protein
MWPQDGHATGFPVHVYAKTVIPGFGRPEINAKLGIGMFKDIYRS